MSRVKQFRPALIAYFAIAIVVLATVGYLVAVRFFSQTDETVAAASSSGGDDIARWSDDAINSGTGLPKSTSAGNDELPAEPDTKDANVAQSSLTELEGPSSDEPSATSGETVLPLREQLLQEFIARQGAENVIVIRIRNGQDLRPGVLAGQLRNELNGGAWWATKVRVPEAIIAIRYDGELADVTERIQWGTVTSVEPKKRLIRVDGGYRQAKSSDEDAAR